MKVILTGTTGHLGSRVLTSLLTHNLISPSSLIISSSSPDKVPSIAKQHSIPVIPGDFTNPTALSNSYASANADILFLVSYPSPSVDRWLHHKTAIDAARNAGIKLIVYTSLMFGGETGMKSVAGVQQAHIKTIKYLQQQREVSSDEFNYVILREGIYAESWWLYAGFQRQDIASTSSTDNDSDLKITFVIPNDGPIAWVSWDDLGEGTARILARLAALEWDDDRKRFGLPSSLQSSSQSQSQSQSHSEKEEDQTTTSTTTSTTTTAYSSSTWPLSTLNTSLSLTGPRTTTISQIATLLQSHTSHRISVEVQLVGKAAAKEYHYLTHNEAGKEEWLVDSWVGWFDGIKDGECAVVDPSLSRILGREARGMEEYMGALFGAGKENIV